MTPEDPSTGSNLPALVLHAARDIGSVETALDAEILLSTLLGSVYSAVLPDRGAAAESFTRALYQHLSVADEPITPIVTAVLDALTGATAAADRPLPSPAWLTQLGRITVTGCYAYGDRYGDQTSYVATFAYDDEVLGGPEHAIAVLADHNLGLAKDIFVVAPATGLIERLREDVSADSAAMSWFSEIEPSTVRAASIAYLTCTDNAADLPDEDSLPANRAIALARLALLPEPAPFEAPPGPDGEAARFALIEEFLGSPEVMLAGLLEQGAPEAVTYCVGLIVDFANLRGDALRWSPVGVDTFLLSWVHEKAILDADDAALLPDALRAWIAWAGHRVGLPEKALQETMVAVASARDEFARLQETGERRSPGARAMAALLADGVDIDDPAAVQAWLATYNDMQG